MKRLKLLALPLVAIMMFGLTACGQAAQDGPPPEADQAAVADQVDDVDDDVIENDVEDSAIVDDGNDDNAAVNGDRDWTIVVMPKLIGIPYFNASEVGALQAGEDFGVNVLYVGPTDADATEQVRMIEDLIQQGVDAIAVAPNDSDALTPVLRRASEAGILILDWDTPADPSVVHYSIQQIDNQEYAELYFDKMVELVGYDDFEFAIITGGLNAANLNIWIDLGLEYAATAYPNLTLVTDRVASDESQQIAYERALELLTAHPNLRAILGYSTPAPLGAAMAVQERGLQDEIVVVGSTTPQDSIPFLEDGSLDVGLLWDPAKLGYLTVFAAIEALEGRALYDGQDVPNVGVISVDGQAVVMGPPSLWTIDNARDFDF